jgi:hypothetical protein
MPLGRDRSVSHTFGLNNLNENQANYINLNSKVDTCSINNDKKSKKSKSKNRYAFSPILSH